MTSFVRWSITRSRSVSSRTVQLWLVWRKALHSFAINVEDDAVELIIRVGCTSQLPRFRLELLLRVR